MLRLLLLMLRLVPVLRAMLLPLSLLLLPRPRLLILLRGQALSVLPPRQVRPLRQLLLPLLLPLLLLGVPRLLQRGVTHVDHHVPSRGVLFPPGFDNGLRGLAGQVGRQFTVAFDPDPARPWPQKARLLCCRGYASGGLLEEQQQLPGERPLLDERRRLGPRKRHICGLRRVPGAQQWRCRAHLRRGPGAQREAEALVARRGRS
mmetsp:Transcript_32558/g.89866  ORF Transcript_32558/g.89866 Transcript_32558/m.89866 type:complete len:204 (+) Transcript_32558:2-613(+)